MLLEHLLHLGLEISELVYILHLATYLSLIRSNFLRQHPDLSLQPSALRTVLNLLLHSLRPNALILHPALFDLGKLVD